MKYLLCVVRKKKYKKISPTISGSGLLRQTLGLGIRARLIFRERDVY